MPPPISQDKETDNNKYQQLEQTAIEDNDVKHQTDAIPISYPSEFTTESSSNLNNLPALKNWKTSVGFSILGLIASKAFQMILMVIFSVCIGFYAELFTGNEAITMGFVALSNALAIITISIFAIAYIYIFYFSYFKTNPQITSSKVISFFNFFFGGVIFGALWNSNLTRSRIIEKEDKGVSYIYATILFSLVIIIIGYMCINQSIYTIEYANNHVVNTTTTNQKASNSSSKRSYSYSDTGFSAPQSIMMAAPLNAISWSEASQHIGETQCVTGWVKKIAYNASDDGQPTFLDIGAEYPDMHRLVIIISGEHREEFIPPPEELYKNKQICVSGQICLYDGVCSIEVNSPSQITVLGPFNSFEDATASTRSLFLHDEE